MEASPRQADFATPSMGFSERFDAQAEASNTPSEAAAAGLLVEEEEQQQQEERPASAAVRGSKPRGRGGSRGGSAAATASARGEGGPGGEVEGHPAEVVGLAVALQIVQGEEQRRERQAVEAARPVAAAMVALV